MTLHAFDPHAFLRDYWQKKPLLIRGALKDWVNSLDPDELAGLACEEGVESRLIMRGGSGWTLEQGPFGEDRFGQLGDLPWTLLVQAVNHHVPEVAALLDPFRFVPNWRVDDVMVSYASDRGGVGPHFDRYDVFLVQGLGRRRWRVGQHCDAGTPLLPHDDLKLLAHFETTDEWILEPGDILYVPPGVAHDGEAVGDDCMTYSIGFRAPARAELVAHWCDHLLEDMADDDLYADPDLKAQANPGEISPSAVAGLQAMVMEAFGDTAAFARWFGTYNSRPKYPEVDWRPEEPVTQAEVRAWVADGLPLRRNPASRFSFVRTEEGVMLFVDGENFDCAGAASGLAQALCVGDIDEVPEDDEAIRLVTALVNQGSAAFDQE